MVNSEDYQSFHDVVGFTSIREKMRKNLPSKVAIIFITNPASPIPLVSNKATSMQILVFPKGNKQHALMTKKTNAFFLFFFFLYGSICYQ